MKISVFGLGYVGAVSCGCMADLGHEIVGVDVDPKKVALINDGKAPVMEPGLEERIQAARDKGLLRAITDPKEAILATDCAMVCVGTPSTRSGGVNAVYLQSVAKQIGEALREHPNKHYPILIRSTCLAPIHAMIREILVETSGRTLGDGIGYVCHPEFLRESVAVADFYDPPKIVYGASDPKTEEMCKELYPGIDAPTFFVTTEVASMIKYADNCYHAVKVTFANEIGTICKELDIDSHAVMDVFCQDRKLNISTRYLKPGSAFGGSCLPKDMRGILDMARDSAAVLPMLAGALESNESQKARLLHRIAHEGRVPVGIVGLAFKENTDDIRESPAISLTEGLLGRGHDVLVYDRHLAVDHLTGSNKSFALAAIPHLTCLLRQELQEVVDHAKVIVVTHRLTPEMWGAVKWKPGQTIIDLVGIPELKDVPGYDGVYW